MHTPSRRALLASLIASACAAALPARAEVLPASHSFTIRMDTDEALSTLLEVFSELPDGVASEILTSPFDSFLPNFVADVAIFEDKAATDAGEIAIKMRLPDLSAELVSSAFRAYERDFQIRHGLVLSCGLDNSRIGPAGAGVIAGSRFNADSEYVERGMLPVTAQRSMLGLDESDRAVA